VFALAGALGLSTAAACEDRAAEQTQAYALRFDDFEIERELSGDISRSRVRELVDEAAATTAVFMPGDAADAKALAGRFAAQRLRTASGAEVLRVELSVDPPGDIQAALGREFEATVELERTDGEIEMDRDLPVAIQRSVSVLEAKVLLVRGDAATLQRLLGHPDPELVLLTLDWVHAHRMREHGDAVARLVDHADERVALRAVECLGVVGTERHARVLVANPRLADRAHTHRLYETLAHLGGPDAAGFLEFAARNEDDPVMADLARNALARMREDGESEDGASRRRPRSRGHR
jgi:hypothetical protein